MDYPPRWLRVHSSGSRRPFGCTAPLSMDVLLVVRASRQKGWWRLNTAMATIGRRPWRLSHVSVALKGGRIHCEKKTSPRIVTRVHGFSLSQALALLVVGSVVPTGADASIWYGAGRPKSPLKKFLFAGTVGRLFVIHWWVFLRRGKVAGSGLDRRNGGNRVPINMVTLVFVQAESRSLLSGAGAGRTTPRPPSQMTRRFCGERFASFLRFGDDVRRGFGSLPMRGSPAITSSQACMAASSKSGASAGSTCQPVTSLPRTSIERMLGKSRRSDSW